MNFLTVKILPSYGQILIKDDVIVSDFPDWSDFGEDDEVVASSQAIHVITIPDHLGKVEVTISNDGPPRAFRSVYRGQLNVSSGRIAVTIPDSPLPGEAGSVATTAPGIYDVDVSVAEGRHGVDKVWLQI